MTIERIGDLLDWDLVRPLMSLVPASNWESTR